MPQCNVREEISTLSATELKVSLFGSRSYMYVVVCGHTLLYSSDVALTECAIFCFILRLPIIEGILS